MTGNKQNCYPKPVVKFSDCSPIFRLRKPPQTHSHTVLIEAHSQHFIVDLVHVTGNEGKLLGEVACCCNPQSLCWHHCTEKCPFEKLVTGWLVFLVTLKAHSLRTSSKSCPRCRGRKKQTLQGLSTLKEVLWRL